MAINTGVKSEVTKNFETLIILNKFINSKNNPRQIIIAISKLNFLKESRVGGGKYSVHNNPQTENRYSS